MKDNEKMVSQGTFRELEIGGGLGREYQWLILWTGIHVCVTRVYKWIILWE